MFKIYLLEHAAQKIVWLNGTNGQQLEILDFIPTNENDTRGLDTNPATGWRVTDCTTFVAQFTSEHTTNKGL